jgi:transposase InsO family protein
MAPRAQPVTGAKLIGKLFPTLRYKSPDFINRATVHDEIPNFREAGFIAPKPRKLRQVVQQLREAWAYKQPHRFLLFDRDAKFGADVVSAVRDIGSQPTRTAFRSPWQNGVAERWVGSCRCDLRNHVIILNERHLKRLMSSYLLYYHEDRTHLGLAKDTPAGRPTEIRSGREGQIQSLPRLGLHHRYAVVA